MIGVYSDADFISGNDFNIRGGIVVEPLYLTRRGCRLLKLGCGVGCGCGRCTQFAFRAFERGSGESGGYVWVAITEDD